MATPHFQHSFARLIRRGAWLPCLLLLGCIDTDTAVFVSAQLGAPALAVTSGPLGVGLNGQFSLELHLGARASGTSQVSYGGFAVRSADQSEVLLEGLPVSANQPSPVSVEPGSDVTVTFTIDTGATTLPADLRDRLCAGQIVITGNIEDSLESGTSPVASVPFTPSGC